MYTFYSYYVVYQVYMFLYDVQCCFSDGTYLLLC